MKAKLVGLAVAAVWSLPACMTGVEKLSCEKDSDCQNAYCETDVHGGPGACVTCQAKELTCSDGLDQDCDGKVDCADEDCQGAVCRLSAGPCDPAELCSAGSCPADGLSATGLTCREQSACGPAATCDGKSAKCPGTATEGSKGAVCRDLGCAEKAFCDGVSPDCPLLALKEVGTACEGVSGQPCLVAGVCDGVSPKCPEPLLLPATEKCPDLKGCETDRFCSGTSGACAVEQSAPKAQGEACRAPAGGCDVEEVCDGTSLECPEDAYKLAAEVCRLAADLCEKDTVCDGVSVQCPVLRRDRGEECRPAQGPCDLAESCSGLDSACPENALVPAEQKSVCREAAGECDLPETCDGVQAACPDNVLVAAQTPCRSAVPGGCDLAEACDGLSAHCPDEAVVAAGTTCRAAAGLCDAVETCDGVSNLCPEDKPRAAGEVCKSGYHCTYDALCDGQTMACPLPENKPEGTACGVAPDPCALPPTCDAAGRCGLPTVVQQGSPCGLMGETCLSSGSTTTSCSWPNPSISTSEGWTWENPLPQGNALNATVAFGGARYFVGDAGTLLRYAASGFERIAVQDKLGKPLRTALRSACLDAGGKLWVAGDAGYLGSFNAMQSAVVAEQAWSGVENLRAMWCEVANKVFVVDGSGAVYRWDGATSTRVPDGTVDEDPNAIWGSSSADLWVVGRLGTVAHRDASGTWTKLTCPEASKLTLTGVSSANDPSGPTDVWISGRSLDSAVRLPGVYRVKRTSAGTQPTCEAYRDPDNHPPPGLNAISVTGLASAWAVGEGGEAYQMVGGQWLEPVPVGIQRSLYVVDAQAANGAGEVVVAGLAGAISIRKEVASVQRWLPSRSITWATLNAVWTGISLGIRSYYAAGTSGTVLKRDAASPWAQEWPVLVSDELTCIASSTGLDLWAAGKSSAGDGIVYESNGTSRSVAVPGAKITGMGVTPGFVTLAAGVPYQVDRSRGDAFVKESAEAATAVVSAPLGSKAWFAGQSVWAMAGAEEGLPTQVTRVDAFPEATYVGIDAGFDGLNQLTDLYAATTEKIAYHLDVANVAGVAATPCSLWAEPLAVKAVSPGRYWVVGKTGLAKLCGPVIAEGPEWAGTNLALRGIAADPFGVSAVGEKGMILRRDTPNP